MKRIIDIPEEVIEAFESGDINNGYYDYNSLIGKAIRNSTSLNEIEAVNIQKYINALRKCAKEHEKEFVPTFNIRTTDLCNDTAKLLEALEQKPCEECRNLKDIKDLLEKKAQALDGVPISDGGGACIGIYFSIANDLPPVQPKANKVLEDIKDEIKQWYWQADKQQLAKDPCVVDAMVDMFIRTIDKHISGEE